MSDTYRDKPKRRRKKVHAPLPPRPPKSEERKIWVGDEAIVEKHFLQLTRLLRNEEREEQNRFKTEFLDQKPEVREKKGKAIFRLDLLETHYNPSGQKLLTFALQNNRPLPRYALNPGEVVSLSGFQTPLSECPAGTVYEKDRFRITVAFSGRIPGWVESEKSYQLSLTENRTTYQRMYEALQMTRSAEHNRIALLRDISLGLKKPRLGDPVPVAISQSFDPSLNDDQKRAVAMALEAQDILLIHGPPGTGKTRVLTEIIRQASVAGQTVLVSAPSNAACDHLVECLVKKKVPVTRLGHPARITERIREHTLSYKLAAHPYAKMIDAHEAQLEQFARQKERRQDRRVMSWEERNEMRDEVNRLRDDIRDLKTQIFKQVWNASDVVVATHTVCGDPLIRAKAFDWVILDEATQGIEPASWIPIRHGGKIILAGDHCQLPPTVFRSRPGERGLGFTLFERLHEVLGPKSKVRLERQYRMHEHIMDFSSRKFYDSALVADPSVGAHTLKGLENVKPEGLDETPAVFLDTAGLGYEEEIEDGTESRYNSEEARLVMTELKRLIAAGVSPAEIAIISPYSAQVKLLTGMILGDKSDPGEMATLEIDSVDAFQGREKEAVILSLVRSNREGQLGFLTDTRRMNVAMTRAKRKLIMIGDSATLSNHAFFEDLLRYIESINGYRSGWEDK
jgi:superfamily I DNA and/or RNA helicase